MAASDALAEFIEAEHTEENWMKAWPLLRKNTALEAHGVDLLRVNEFEIVLRMEIDSHAKQPFGLLHGGISMLLAESAASMHSCWGLDLPSHYPVGIEINGSHMRSAMSGAVLAIGRVVRRSGTLVHHNVEIVAEETGKVLSAIRVTNLIRKG